jgi:hypothetical protein
MDFENENDYTTYLFTLTTVGLVFSQIFLDNQYDNFAFIGYAIVACGFFFIYQFFKLSSLKKELKKSDKKILKKISKNGSSTINVISIFNNAELFENSKNRAIYNKFELAKKSVLFSFYATLILISCYLIF